MKHANLVSGLVGGIVAVAAFASFGGGVGQPVRQDFGPFITNTFGVDINSTSTGSMAHVLYRSWSDGQIDYAIVRGNVHARSTGKVLESKISDWGTWGPIVGRFDSDPVVYGWRVLTVN